VTITVTAPKNNTETVSPLDVVVDMAGKDLAAGLEVGYRVGDLVFSLGDLVTFDGLVFFFGGLVFTLGDLVTFGGLVVFFGGLVFTLGDLVTFGCLVFSLGALVAFGIVFFGGAVASFLGDFVCVGDLVVFESLPRRSILACDGDLVSSTLCRTTS